MKQEDIDEEKFTRGYGPASAQLPQYEAEKMLMRKSFGRVWGNVAPHCPSYFKKKVVKIISKKMENITKIYFECKITQGHTIKTLLEILHYKLKKAKFYIT